MTFLSVIAQHTKGMKRDPLSDYQKWSLPILKKKKEEENVITIKFDIV